jgi:hypothetical protein
MMPNYTAIYYINWNRLLSWSVDQALMLPKQKAWLEALYVPINTVYNRFLTYREDAHFRIVTNGQMCRLRGALNTKFDTIQRRITITQGGDSILYAYTIAENQSQYLPQYLGNGISDFVVNVPIEIEPFGEDIKRLIETYKRPTKTYTINYV